MHAKDSLTACCHKLGMTQVGKEIAKLMEHSYKLVIAYDGTDYHGWQRQKEHCSIDSVIRETFLRVFLQESIRLVGASRTDAGVHARGQVIRLRTILPVCPHKMLFVLNRALPQDIKIMSCVKVDNRFHPQHTVVLKTYSYTFSLQKLSPMDARYSWQYPFTLCFDRLEEALALFVGTHDFRYFCKEVTDKDTMRTIESIVLTRAACGQKHTVTIKGKSFLRFMIRRIMGASLALASSKDLDIMDLQKLLSGERECVKLLITAPAQGLCLESIEYD
jgi:tRNA pseudouridine38-40 synthase